MHVTAIVLAAGAGRRIGADVSKTYLSIAGRPLVLRALDRMFAAKTVEEVILVVAEMIWRAAMQCCGGMRP
jgi:2-C-methyl-D-erythritol 4-phosphate cytidylyltransferase